MKLALIHHQLSRGGGMETYFVDLIHECVRLGHEVHVIVAKVSRDFDLPPSVRLQILPNSIWPKFLRKYCFAWHVTRYCATQHFDLTISTTRSFNADILITGGTHKGYLQANPRFRWSDPIETFLETRAYRSAKKIIAHSPQIETDLFTLYHLPRAKIAMAYPPVDDRQFTYHPHAPHQPLRLLFVSTSHRRKGGYLLLEALKQLPARDFELWIAGRAFPKAQKLPHTVRFMGYVKDIAALYQAADLVVLPSYFEPFGLVVAQALASGTPILVSARSGVSALVGATEGLILHTQTVEALKDSLCQAKDASFSIEPDFVKRNGLTLQAHVKKIFDL